MSCLATIPNGLLNGRSGCKRELGSHFRKERCTTARDTLTHPSNEVQTMFPGRDAKQSPDTEPQRASVHTSAPATHFYVRPAPELGGPENYWAICRDNDASALALYAELAIAVRETIGLARRRVARGESAQVHVRFGRNERWRTQWYSDDEQPLYP